MTSYLQHGWYADGAGRARLRTEVIDGAMDVAGMLLRAGVPAHRVLRVALKVRSLVVIADPLMHGTARFGQRDRKIIAMRVETLTDGFPELQGFVNDCLENVSGARDMTAFYLHMVHITRMMQLLAHAASIPELLLESPAKEAPARRKPAGRKKKKKKKTGKKTACKKPTSQKKKTGKKTVRKKPASQKKKTGKKTVRKKPTSKKKTRKASKAKTSRGKKKTR